MARSSAIAVRALARLAAMASRIDWSFASSMPEPDSARWRDTSLWMT